MRIGIVTTWFERGAAYVSRQYAKSFFRKNDVLIYARGGGQRGDDKFDNSNVTLAKTNGMPLASAFCLEDFTRWIEQQRIDLVFFNEQTWWDPVIRCAEIGLPTGSYIDYYTEETVPLFGAFDFLVCNTRRHASVFDWHPQCIYMPWGTELDVFTPTTNTKRNDTDVVTFFHSSGFSPRRKGTDILLEAFGRLDSRARLVIHTQFDLAKRMPETHELLGRLQSSGRLTVIEKTVPAPGLYHLGDVYVYPSRLDGIGLTVAEALACGLPVITSDNPPMNEFIDDSCGKLIEISGFKKRDDNYYWPMCEPDVESLARQMHAYCEDYANLPKLKEQARQFAEDHLDWNINSAPLSTRIEEALAALPYQGKSKAIANAKKYESNRVSVPLALYRLFPSLYRTFRPMFGVTKQLVSRS